MSEAKPIENKVEAAAKVVDTAVALTSPTTAPVVAAKVGWSMLRHRKRLMYIAAGAALGIAIGVYEFKYFKADPGTTMAQQGEPTAVAQGKPDEPAKPSADSSERLVPTLD